MSLILGKIVASHKQNLPFVCFNKPNTTLLKGYFGKDSNVRYSNSFKEEGFVFAPFNNENPAIIFLNKTFEIVEGLYENKATIVSKNNYEDLSSDKEKHLKLVRLGIDAIQNNNFTKVVLSRKEIVHTTAIDVLEVFERLLQKYQNAFVYVWFHPKVGLWMGATPEKLVTLQNGKFHTTALASTQTYKDNLNPVWGNKEKKEHQYVVDYIVSQIKDQQNGIILKNFTSTQKN